MFQVATTGMLLECCSGQNNNPYLELISAAPLETSGSYLSG